MNNIKDCLKTSFRFLVIVTVLSTFATSVASAKTVTSTSSVIDSATLDYFENIYKRSNYKNYVIASEYITSGVGYNYITYYYFCLSNQQIEVSDPINVNASCDVLYRSYRNNNTYVLERQYDNNLIVSNNIYYTNNIYDTNYALNKLLVLISICLFSFYLSYVLIKIFRS